jgi:hypothetical protein
MRSGEERVLQRGWYCGGLENSRAALSRPFPSPCASPLSAYVKTEDCEGSLWERMGQTPACAVFPPLLLAKWRILARRFYLTASCEQA